MEGTLILKNKFQPWQLTVDSAIEEVVRVAEKKYPILTQDTVLQQLALFHKALGDETRLRIVAMLMVQDVCLCEIVEGLQIPTSTINHHLKILERGGVIEGRREGKFTVYTVDQTKLNLIPLNHREDNQQAGGKQNED